MNEKRSLAAHLRTFIIVTLITLMVWFLAESRMVRTGSIEASLLITVVDTPGGAVYVARESLAPDQKERTRTVSIEVEGSTAGIDRFSRALQNRVELRVGRDIPAEVGVHTLDLKTILNQSQDYALHGVVIQGVSVEEVTVQVDELMTAQLPIRIELPEDVELDGVPRADPALVTVTGPSTLISESIGSDVAVQVTDSMLSQLTPGRLETLPGLVAQLSGVDSDAWAISVEPAQVDVLLTLQMVTDSITVPRLPVQIVMAPDSIGRWIVEIDDAEKDLVGVMIVGPASSIERIRSGEVLPQAVLNLSFEDLGRRVRSKSARVIGLPTGCRVQNPDFSVNLRILPVEELNSEPVQPDSAGASADS